MRATDPSGNTDATPATRTWTVDTLPPNTTITSGPSGWSTSAAPAFSFTATEPGASFQCSLDSGLYTSCTSPRAYSALPDGPHTFRVRALDAARNVDPTPAERTWSIDTAVPDTSLDGGTAGPTNEPDATFPFSSPDTTARFACSLDAAAYAACTSPAKYPDLADGSHTFLVRAIDPAGNMDSSPAARQWDVDTVAPETVITSQPDNPTPSTTATFEFIADEEGGTFACALDGADLIECYAPQVYTDLTPGSHTFTVVGNDSAGNQEQTPATYTWTISPPP